MQAVFYLFLFSVLIQFFYYLFFFTRLAFYKYQKKTKQYPPVSVLISAKNEAENLKKNLSLFYKQNYPDFEMVLIDDRSVDNTREIMADFQEKYPLKTRVVGVEFSDNPRFIGNKKYALTLGIKAAKYNHLLFTDADCRPESPQWIEKMSGNFTDKKQLVLGYGKYEKQKGFLNKLIRFETLQTAMQYFSYALAGMPYMGVGRNLGYTKELFFDNNGFYDHMHLLSGDDDLFVNKAATKENTAVVLEKGSATISVPKQTWKDWIHQKRRHITTASHYRLKHKILLALYYLSTVLFYFTAFFLLIKGYQWKIVLTLFLFRLIFAFLIQYKIAQKLDEKDIIKAFPLYEISLILIQFYIFILNLIRKPKTWRH